MKTEVDTEAMHLQAKECQKLPAATRNEERHGPNSPSESPEGTNPVNTFTSDFQTQQL